MRSDAQGCSTCHRGEERRESFHSGGKSYVQYDYRTPDGRLFSTVASTLDEARQRRDGWLAKQREGVV